MNSVAATTFARSFGFLTLVCAVCCFSLISAVQDAAPPLAASARSVPRDLRQADESFLQFEGASAKAAHE
jgi:hypothetical protein